LRIFAQKEKEPPELRTLNNINGLVITMSENIWNETTAHLIIGYNEIDEVF
jgi:hypothetical protein